MELRKAIEVLLRHNVSRKGFSIDEEDQTEVSEAIHTAVGVMSVYDRILEQQAKGVAVAEPSCDACGCHPSVLIKTEKGTFCAEHARY